MSITLYTPATGFPDLEIKIAYGLARVGIEAECNPVIIPQQGFYQIALDSNRIEKFNKTFQLLLGRLLTSPSFFDLGVKAKDRNKYPVDEDVLERIKQEDIVGFYKLNRLENFDFRKKEFCGHEKHKFGGSSGLILLSSFHAGKPYSRDKRRDTFNLNLCEICGYLAVLGLYSFGFIIQMGKKQNKKYTVVLPIPQKELCAESLQVLLSTQKTLHNFWLSDIQPLQTFPIGLLAKVPSISDIVNKLQLYFYLSLVSKDNRGDTVIEQTAFIDTMPISKFISSSPYNSATIDKLLGSNKKDDPPKVASLIEIGKIIEHNDKTVLPEFARLYVQETSGESYTNLLYLETARYLLKEVAMISDEIINSPALTSLAKTLRYFIREKKYGYADNIRNARKDSGDFENTVAKMLREGRLRLEQKEKIHLPTEEEMKEVFRLANTDFESTKIALVILAFSFPAKGEEVEENKEEEQNA